MCVLPSGLFSLRTQLLAIATLRQDRGILRRGNTIKLLSPEGLIWKNFREERPQVLFSSEILEVLQSCSKAIQRLIFSACFIAAGDTRRCCEFM